MLKKKFLLRPFLFLIGVIGLLIIGILAFLNLAPQIGASPSGAHLEELRKSPNYQEDQFVNLITTEMDQSLSNIWGMTKEALASQNTSPKQVIPTFFQSSSEVKVFDSTFHITWYGHSAVLLEIDGKRIFLDPMLGPAASPLPFFGKRFQISPSFELEKLAYIDAVIFSHDHYDHLDYPTIKAIKDSVGHFYTPLGLGAHLVKWGVTPEKITELDWWQDTTFQHLKLTATPARHFSGRGIGDGNKTLWASWVIQGKKQNIFFSGDSGYGPHFREIGEKYGPFDLTMMECGQYNDRWKAIHMMPEESVEAQKDLRGEVMMPIHWGAFSLAPHSWIDPAEQVTYFAQQAGVVLITPEIGQRFSLDTPLPTVSWWDKIE